MSMRTADANVTIAIRAAVDPTVSVCTVLRIKFRDAVHPEGGTDPDPSTINTKSTTGLHTGPGDGDAVVGGADGATVDGESVEIVGDCVGEEEVVDVGEAVVVVAPHEIPDVPFVAILSSALLSAATSSPHCSAGAKRRSEAEDKHWKPLAPLVPITALMAAGPSEDTRQPALTLL